METLTPSSNTTRPRLGLSPTTPVKFSALLRRLDEAVINALNNGGPWSQVDQLQAELIACPDCTWSMQQVDYYIRQTHYK